VTSERSEPRTSEQLIERLRNGSDTERARACRELAALRDPAAIPALLDALEDEDGGVRWLAAVALIELREAAVIPLLERLLQRVESPWFREGAHHVLRSLVTPTLTPVVEALTKPFPEESVPLAVNEALKALRSG
jgi:HEAT repeat protein